MLERACTFRAMNTGVTLAIVCESARAGLADSALHTVQRTFELAETTLSRFLSDSELSQLNRAHGQPFRASSILFNVVADAVSAARMTDGWFDPTILGALISAGYDRSFELIREGVSAPARGYTSVGAWRKIRMTEQASTITLPSNCGLDLGGIGKGWTVDQAVRSLRDFPSFAIDAGGDMYLGGQQVDGSPWTVGIEDPTCPERNILVLVVRDRAVATSSVTHRRWKVDEQTNHHLIDPRTGRPSDNGILSATVVSNSVARAEVLAKVALLRGPKKGVEFLNDQPDAEGILISRTGQIERSVGFPEVTNAA